MFCNALAFATIYEKPFALAHIVEWLTTHTFLQQPKQ